jgi:hypothetical protein
MIFPHPPALLPEGEGGRKRSLALFSPSPFGRRGRGMREILFGTRLKIRLTTIRSLGTKGAAQRGSNEGQDVVGMVEDLTVLEAQDADADPTKEAVASDIPRRRREVPRTIGFDDELGVFAIEVNDEGTQGLLASELCAIETAIAKKVPEALLGRSG